MATFGVLWMCLIVLCEDYSIYARASTDVAVQQAYGVCYSL